MPYARFKFVHAALFSAALFSPVLRTAAGQAPATAGSAVPHGSGTVKTVSADGLVVTTAGGQQMQVAVPAGVPVLLVQPGSHDLKTAQKGTVADITAGDRVLVNGTAGDVGDALHASRVIVMKSGAIAATRAAEQAAWAQGVGGIVRSIDPDNGHINVSSGMRNITVETSPRTVVRRYAGGSVRFEDAVQSSVSAIHPGDQLRARGDKSPDGNALVAEEIVTGSFSNFSGVLSAVDAAAGTVTLKDLASKREVTVKVTPASNVRRLPADAAQAMSAREAGGTGQAHGAEQPAAGSPAGAGEHRSGGPGVRAGGTGGDLSRMVSRLPAETLADLKPGEAVMIVASNSGGSGESTAVTLLAGVEQILAAHPTGETTLSPWNIGGGGEGDAEGGGEAGGGSR